MTYIRLSTTIKLIYFLQTHIEVQCFWPPAYVIDLHDNDTFEISEDLGMNTDDIVEDSDEMIPERELSRFQFNKNPHKFVRLHQIIDGIEKRAAEHEVTHSSNSFNYTEENFYHEYPEERNTSHFTYYLKESLNVEYHNNMSKNSIKSNNEEKRQLNDTDTKATIYESNKDYNYDEMKRRFEEKIVEEISTEIKYTEMKEYEGAADSLKTIWKEKDEINCTLEEMKNINSKALLCLLKEPKSNKASKFFTRLGEISLIWLIVYIVIAVPLWCTRGWCCCCFRCEFCQPRNKIDWIKEYFIKNPVGVIHDNYENRVVYQPTNYEKYYYENLEKELRKLISH
ncbi:uncharacterized protein LOC123671423 isoform X1 [Harmonia axyridis]|uniref:uncharacterized protein LOC123671423 isoform X1 n=1 Tax=Harmonia axyridis TaxID=115357 RepID=UPI001E2786AC|nr:uncharacterized protein LOC123671423 isoform X1 [Harmonia axyridis]